MRRTASVVTMLLLIGSMIAPTALAQEPEPPEPGEVGDDLPLYTTNDEEKVVGPGDVIEFVINTTEEVLGIGGDTTERIEKAVGNITGDGEELVEDIANNPMDFVAETIGFVADDAHDVVCEGLRQGNDVTPIIPKGEGCAGQGIHDVPGDGLDDYL